MKFWKFFDYCLDDGTNLIDQWYHRQSVEVRADIDVMLITLMGAKDWTGMREAEELDRQHTGLWALRLKINGVNYRIPGFVKRQPHRGGPYSLIPGEFVMLIGCTKNGRVTTPVGAFDSAMEFKEHLQAGRGSVYEHP